MFGLVLLTGLTAIAVLALLGSALGRSRFADGLLDDDQIAGAAQAPAGPAAATAGPPADPATTPARRPARRDASGREILSMTARLTFVHSPSPEIVVLDCTLGALDDDPDDVVPPGTPFTLQLRLPETAWFATSLGLLLEQWAEECRTVEIALLARDGHAKAHVADGSSRVMLEVDAAAGLSVT